MKLSTLILYFAVWSVSLVAAYYLGSYGGNVVLNTEQAAELPTELKKPKLIQFALEGLHYQICLQKRENLIFANFALRKLIFRGAIDKWHAIDKWQS